MNFELEEDIRLQSLWFMAALEWFVAVNMFEDNL
jgi:hypothetical protein